MSTARKPPFVLPKRARTAEEWASEAEMATKTLEDKLTAVPPSNSDLREVPAPAPAPIADPAPAAASTVPVPVRVVKRQVNIEVPETLHLELKAFVKTLPDMNVTKFLLLAAQKEMGRLKQEREG